jgi:hypothetical protein
MQLLSGAEITITFDPEAGHYIAFVYVGATHKMCVASNPVRALGMAILLQAGYTEGSLKAELANQSTHAGKE